MTAWEEGLSRNRVRSGGLEERAQELRVLEESRKGHLGGGKGMREASDWWWVSQR